MKPFIATWLERWRRPAAAPTEPLCELPARLELSEAQRVMAFVPHPDDESIGCGGALALLAAAAVPLRVVLVSDGSGAGALPPEAAGLRQEEFRAALRRLGVTNHGMLGFPDGNLVLDGAMRDAIGREVAAFEPTWIFAPSHADLHRDHRVVSAAVRHAALCTASVTRVCEYEVWSPLPLTHVLDITAVLDIKLAALAEHHTALACRDYLTGTAGLAKYRGLLLDGPQSGAAEGFLCTTRDKGFKWARAWGVEPG